MYICTSKQNQTYENKVASALTMTGPVLCVDSNYFWDSVSNYEQFQNMRKVIFSLRIVVHIFCLSSKNLMTKNTLFCSLLKSLKKILNFTTMHVNVCLHWTSMFTLIQTCNTAKVYTNIFKKGCGPESTSGL